MRLDFQVGTSKRAHKILGRLAGRLDDDDEDEKTKKNIKAPFEKMSDAYLFALVLGLSKGKKIQPVQDRINYDNFSSVEGDLDIYSMLKIFGKKEDILNKDAVRIAIEEYATWGLIHIDSNYAHGDDDFRFAEIFG